jgi:pilus assembly protein CpaB
MTMLRTAIFALAIISGGASAWLSVGGVDRVTAGPGSAAAAVPMEHVLVATTDIVSGTTIPPGALRWHPWPQDALNESYITQTAEPDADEALVGMTVRGAIMSGEPVYRRKLVDGEAGLLSRMLTSGQRAVSVKISADNTAGGFILPNDRVDVLHTRMRLDTEGQSEASSRAILRKVRVLAIDQSVDAETGSVVGKTATLELTSAQVEIIVAAEASGTITFALRSKNDLDEPSSDLAQARPVNTIRVIRGRHEEVIVLR